MTTLAEIETAADALTDEDKQKLLAFLASRLRATGEPMAAPRPPSFAERYSPFIGAATDLPTDLAANLDHYLHGHPKR